MPILSFGTFALFENYIFSVMAILNFFSPIHEKHSSKFWYLQVEFLLCQHQVFWLVCFSYIIIAPREIFYCKNIYIIYILPFQLWINLNYNLVRELCYGPVGMSFVLYFFCLLKIQNCNICVMVHSLKHIIFIDIFIGNERNI